MEPKKANDPDELGGWRITGRLGEGGFGTVFLAEKGAQKAAIKVIRQEFVEEDDARSRLATEAEVLSKLSDPSIGKILDSDLSGALPWIATEFINGPTLEDKVKYEGPLEGIVWFNLAANIFHAIVSANELGIIHKDIKPSNIILGETGNKLIDFGIAHISGQTRSAVFGDREGSTPFSSPEHFLPKPNPKMDVFSAASTLAYASRGKSIWKGDNDLQLMRSINQDEPDLEGLTEIQKKFLIPLLEKNPSDRLGALEAHKSSLNYIQFLLGKSKQPRSPKLQNRIKRSLSKRTSLSLSVLASIGFLAFSFQSGVFSNESTDALTSQCRTSLQNGNLDLAIETCTRAVAAGSENAEYLLARAHMAKGSNGQAKLVLEKCKSQSLACRSDYAYFFETGIQSLTNLMSADDQGDKDAAWRIGQYYQGQKDIKKALFWYQKSSKAKNPIANIYLATYWGAEKKTYLKAINYAKLAINGDLTGRPSLIKIDHPVERLIDSLYTNSGDSRSKIDFFTKCANEKVAFCISTVANAYLVNKDLVNAKKWGLIGADLQDAKSMWVLARVAANKNTLLPKGTIDKAIDAEIMGWYKKAAELGDVGSSFALGFFYFTGSGSLETDLKESCSWYQRTMAAVIERKGTYLEEGTDQKDYSDAAQFFQLQSCQKVLLANSPAVNFNSPTASSTAKPNASPTAGSKVTSKASAEPNPVVSSDQFKISKPLAQDVVTDSIFGRAFKDGLNLWHILLTNSSGEKVPPITSIQFRLIGYPDDGWLDVPYKLKTDATFGNVYAEVDDLLFALLFKDQKYCPEFRAVREESGKIVHIWNKGQPECSTDFNP